MVINFARIYFDGFLISQFFAIAKNAKLKTRETNLVPRVLSYPLYGVKKAGMERKKVY